MLLLSAIETFYGPSQALFGVDLNVGEGEVVTLMGRNGMGKTTTIRSVCGMTPARAGRITFAGTVLSGLPPHRIARLGIGLVPEGCRCFPNLTVQEKPHCLGPSRQMDARHSKMPCSRDSASGCVNIRTRCRAANNRCWLSVAR